MGNSLCTHLSHRLILPASFTSFPLLLQTFLCPLNEVYPQWPGTEGFAQSGETKSLHDSPAKTVSWGHLPELYCPLARMTISSLNINCQLVAPRLVERAGTGGHIGLASDPSSFLTRDKPLGKSLNLSESEISQLWNGDDTPIGCLLQG